MDSDRLTRGDLALPAGQGGVKLAVQARGGLIRQQMQWKLRRLRTTQPFFRFQPGRMGRAIVIAELLDGARVEFDLAGGCRQRMTYRITTERLQQHGPDIRLGKNILPGSPERIEVRGGKASIPGFARSHAIHMPQPARFIPPLCV